MWPLSIILLFAAAVPVPQQASSNLDGAYVGKVPQIKSSLGKVPQIRGLQGHALQAGRLSPDELQVQNTCYAIRSYHFERHDGQAPLLTGMTTCTPGRILEQKRVSPERGLYVPLSLQNSDRKQPQ
jgi:hypothetical protein